MATCSHSCGTDVLNDFEAKGSQPLVKECFAGILHDGPTNVSCRRLVSHLKGSPVSPRNENEHHVGHFPGAPAASGGKA